MSESEKPMEEIPAAEPEKLEEESRVVVNDVDRELKRLTRRGFLTAGVAAAIGYGSYKFLRTRPREAGVEWPFRRVLEMNESITSAFFSRTRLSPTFAPNEITKARTNGHIGLKPDFDLATWKLKIEGSESRPIEMTMDDLRRLPKRTQITELRCIEGWSTIVQWSGVRLSDLMSILPPPNRDGSRGDLRDWRKLVRYVSMETPDRAYYVGLDMASALHPQTLLAYEMNGAPLDWHHGSPLRLAIPVKYGIKNIKRIGTIRYTDVRPADFWGNQGYDWYAGH